jgi:hypothetical protein
VQKAGAAFAAQWGAPAGQAALVLFPVLPPFQQGANTRIAATSAISAKPTLTPGEASVCYGPRADIAAVMGSLEQGPLLYVQEQTYPNQTSTPSSVLSDMSSIEGKSVVLGAINSSS